jgi:hypothetical protein
VRVGDDELEFFFRKSQECVEYRLGVLKYAAAGAGAKDYSDAFHFRGAKII